MRREHPTVVALGCLTSGTLAFHSFRPAGVSSADRVQSIPVRDAPARLVFDTTMVRLATVATDDVVQDHTRATGTPLADPEALAVCLPDCGRVPRE